MPKLFFTLHFNQDTEHLSRCLHPTFHRLRCLLGRALHTDKLIHWACATLEIVDDGTEVGRHCIARSTDIEFLLHEEFRLERHVGLGITDADDATCESHLIHCHLIGRRTAHGLNHHIRTKTSGHLQQTGMHILGLAIDGV